MADTDVTAQTLIDNNFARQKDLYKTQWTDAVMLTYVQKGLDYTARLLINMNSDLARSTGTVTLAAGTQEYDLSGNLDNFWQIVPEGVYLDTKPLLPMTKDDAIRAGTGTTDDAPEYYYLTGTKIGLVLTPSATSATAYPTLTCRYYAAPVTLTLTTNMPYKNLFNEPISAFASSLALMKTEVPTGELLAVYNALEEATIAIVRKRANL
jgi:hypothetical protein